MNKETLFASKHFRETAFHFTMATFQRNFMSVLICKKLDIFCISKSINYQWYILTVSFFSVFHFHLIFLNTFFSLLLICSLLIAKAATLLEILRHETSFAFKFVLILKCIVEAFMVPLRYCTVPSAVWQIFCELL